MDSALDEWQHAHKKELLPPNMAWPTLFLFLFAIFFIASSTYFTFNQKLPIGVGLLFNAVAQFMLFTVLHDASHRALAQNEWINDAIGSVAAFILSPIAGMRVFRFIHMQHHRFTNEGGANDPDEWCGKGRAWTLPFRWMTLDWHYLAWYQKKWASRPLKERGALVLTSSLGITLLLLLNLNGYSKWVLMLWLIPSRIATGWLALAFDFLPHYPHDVKASENELRASHVKPNCSWIMTPLFLCQNYHLIHHLYPRAPFYRYPWIWHSAKKELLQAGARVMSWRHKEMNH